MFHFLTIFPKGKIRWEIRRGGKGQGRDGEECREERSLGRGGGEGREELGEGRREGKRGARGGEEGFKRDSLPEFDKIVSQ